MSTTLQDESREALSRVSELAEAVMEAAQRLHATAAAHRQDDAALAAQSPSTPSPHELTAALFTDLLDGELQDGAQVSRRALALGCDLSLGAIGLCVELQAQRPAFVSRLIADTCEEALVQALERHRRMRVYAILPCVRTCVAGSIGSVRQLTSRLHPYGITGVSSFEADAAQVGRALLEAELVIGLIRDSGEHAAQDIGGGTTRLLLRMLASHPGEVREFHDVTIGPLMEYDRHRQTELLPTLQAYLESECNMNVTAASVFAHRHTVAARLERIHALTGLDPLRYEDREQLSLAIKVHRLLAPQLADTGFTVPGGRAAVTA
jgi:sugar diacid utilization regulator